jgi:hypothetical protein
MPERATPVFSFVDRYDGYLSPMEKETTVKRVRAFDTKSGNKRYVLEDADGNEYTTFRPAIGEAAMGLEGQPARLEYHEEERGDFTNIYLDKVEPLREDAAGTQSAGGEDADSDPEEAAWRTAVDAAPWLVGESQPHEETPPDELFDKLKPFKEKVSEDIRKDGEGD